MFRPAVMHTQPRSGRRVALVVTAFWLAVVAIAGASVLIRLPFLQVPLTADEGGYSYVAFFWDNGAQLYRDLWVDRPQLLVLAYQTIQHWIGQGGPALRLGGALYNAVSVVAVALLARHLVGMRWALVSAALFAWFSASPRIEGFTTNGELLTTLPSTLSVFALAVWASREREVWTWGTLLLPLAGALAGTSFLLKQSGIDAAATCALVLAAMLLTRTLRPRRALACAGLFGVGALAPVSIALVHGWATAGSDYTFAIFTYRLTVESLFTNGVGERFSFFIGSLPAAVGELGALALLAWIGIRPFWMSSWAHRVIVLWLVATVAAMSMGGQFHPHYYIATVPPLAILGARGIKGLVTLLRGNGRRIAPAVLTVVVLGLSGLALVRDVSLMRNEDKRDVSYRVFREPRYLVDSNIGVYLRARTDPDDRIYAMFAAADLYYYARRQSPYPYLWFRGVALIPGAFDRLRRVLSDPEDHPAYVVLVQHPNELDPSGSMMNLISRYYDARAVIGGVQIFQAREDRFRELSSTQPIPEPRGKGVVELQELRRTLGGSRLVEPAARSRQRRGPGT